MLKILNKQMNKTISSLIGILIILFVFVIAVVLIWSKAIENKDQVMMQQPVIPKEPKTQKNIDEPTSTTITEAPTQNLQPQPKNNVDNVKILTYKSKKLGIVFEYPESINTRKILVEEKGNQISIYPANEYELKHTIQSLDFKLNKGEQIDSAIKSQFSNGNKTCKVVKKDIKGGVFNEIPLDSKNQTGEYDLYSGAGMDDEVGCGKYQGGGSAHFIYEQAFTKKIIWVSYGNYSFLSDYDSNGSLFINWLISIRYKQ